MRVQQLRHGRNDVVAGLDVRRVGSPAEDGVEMSARGAVRGLPARRGPTQPLGIESDSNALADADQASLERVRRHPSSVPAGKQRPRRPVADKWTKHVLSPNAKGQYTLAVDLGRRRHFYDWTEINAVARRNGEVGDVHRRKLARARSGLVSESDDRARYLVDGASWIKSAEDGEQLLIRKRISISPAAFLPSSDTRQWVRGQPTHDSEMTGQRAHLADVMSTGRRRPRPTRDAGRVFEVQDIPVDVDDGDIHHIGRPAVSVAEPGSEREGFVDVLVDRARTFARDLKTSPDVIEHLAEQHRHPPWLASRVSRPRKLEPRSNRDFVNSLLRHESHEPEAIDGSADSLRQPAMKPSVSAWSEAVASATLGMSDQGARERRRHARLYADWCAATGIDPAASDRDHLDTYLGSVNTEYVQLRSKMRCSLRAVLRQINPALAARAAGLGAQVRLLARNQATPRGELLDYFLGLKPSRRAVRRVGLTRLLAWCSEVGLEVTDLFIGDIQQFREWLGEVRALNGETLGVAKDLILLRHSKAGRHILGESEPATRPLLLETSPPMQPRFDVSRLEHVLATSASWPPGR